MKLQPGPHRQARISVKNVRGRPFYAVGALVGVGATQRAHWYICTSVAPNAGTPKIDTALLAANLGVDGCALNSERLFAMDEMQFSGGEHLVIEGAELVWLADMTVAAVMSQWGKPYNPSLIYRNTSWIYRAGKRVFLLREPGGAVWVMQDFNKNVDPSLEVDRLDELAGKLRGLPQGWKFEAKTLTRSLSLDTARAGGWAAILRDELHCTYQGCGYGADKSANYVP